MNRMTQPDTHQIVHPQLSTESFNNPTSLDEDEEEELTEVPIVPTDLDTSSQTVRVTRPVPPIDFILQRPLTTEKELLDIAFR